MSQLIFKEMVKGNADDLATVVDYFGDDAHQCFEEGYGYLIGFRNGVPVIGATYGYQFSDFDIQSNEGLEAYQAIIAELERLAISVGAASINTIDEAIQDRPKFISALFLQNFDGDSHSMEKILDRAKHDLEEEKLRLLPVESDE